MLCLCCCSGFPLVSTSCCGVHASHCRGFSCCGAQALGTQASVAVTLRLSNTASAAVARGLSCSAACGIFPDQGSDPSVLHGQADSLQSKPPWKTKDTGVGSLSLLNIIKAIYNNNNKKPKRWACLVPQWQRIHLPTQETLVRSLIWEDPTCRRATKRIHHNY